MPAFTSEQSNVDALTWQALLGKWVEFAQASVAMPKTDSGQRFKAAVPAIITLHAVACALAELGTLEPVEQPLAIDRAAYLLNRHAAELRAIWQPEPPPPGVQEIIDDATAAITHARQTLNASASTDHTPTEPQ